VIGFYVLVLMMGLFDDFCYFVDYMYVNGIGVLLDWVSVHFAIDLWVLTWFDGTVFYEHDDPCCGEYFDWGMYVFNFGCSEV